MANVIYIDEELGEWQVFMARSTYVRSAVHVLLSYVCPSIRPSVTLVNCDHKY